MDSKKSQISQLVLSSEDIYRRAADFAEKKPCPGGSAEFIHCSAHMNNDWHGWATSGSREHLDRILESVNEVEPYSR
jgi:hypothetical protein